MWLRNNYYVILIIISVFVNFQFMKYEGGLSAFLTLTYTEATAADDDIDYDVKTRQKNMYCSFFSNLTN